MVAARRWRESSTSLVSTDGGMAGGGGMTALPQVDDVAGVDHPPDVVGEPRAVEVDELVGQLQHGVRCRVVAEGVLGDLPIRVAGHDGVRRELRRQRSNRRPQPRDDTDVSAPSMATISTIVTGVEHRRVVMTEPRRVEGHQRLGELPHVVPGRSGRQESLGDRPEGVAFDDLVLVDDPQLLDAGPTPTDSP